MIVLMAAASGALAGVGHVLSGPDHLAAVAPLALQTRRRTWATGLCWGVGHSAGVWLLAALALALREQLPLEVISAWGERLVGVVLIAIGAWGLLGALRPRLRPGDHQHGDDEPQSAAPSYSLFHGALSVGALHGVAGASHLLGVLPALLLPTRSSAVAYILCYGLGSVAAMTAFAGAAGLATARLRPASPRAARALLTASCVCAIGVGVLWLWSPAAVQHGHSHQLGPAHHH